MYCACVVSVPVLVKLCPGEVGRGAEVPLVVAHYHADPTPTNKMSIWLIVWPNCVAQEKGPPPPSGIDSSINHTVLQ